MEKLNFNLTQFTTGALAANIIGTALLYCLLIFGVEYSLYAITSILSYISQIQIHPIFLILLIPVLVVFFIGFFALTTVILAFFFTLLFISSKLTILTIFQLFKDTFNDLKLMVSKIFNRHK